MRSATARPRRSHGRGQPPPEPEGAGAARQDGVQRVLRGLDPDPAQLRDRRQAAVGRHDELRRVVVERQQGREPPRHDRDDRGDGRRRVRHPAQVERGARGRSSSGPTPASSTPATGGTPTRPRRCSTATRSAPRSTARRLRRAHGSRSSATSSTAGSPAATSGRSRMLGADVTLVAPRTLLPPVVDVPSTTDLDDVIGDVDVLYLLRMQQRADDRVAGARRCASTRRRFGLDARPGRRLPEHALIMHPGPMNRGVEMAVDPSELPGSVITQQVTTASPCGWRCCSTCSAAARDLEERRMSDQLLDHRRHRRRSDGASVAPTCVVDDGRVVEVGADLDADRSPTSVLDAAGCVVGPGLRRPAHPPARTGPRGGRDDRDRLRGPPQRAGTRAVVAMPNTDPTQDSVSVVEFVRRQGEAAGLCDVRPSGSITVGRPGRAALTARRAGCRRVRICSPTTATGCRTRC